MAEMNLRVEKGLENLSITSSNGKELFIIDCDAGNDDAMALLLALNEKVASDVEILGITCVGGNTTLDNVVKNVLRTLKIANRTDVPVFKGATTGIIPRDILRPSRIHGDDGLGGMGHTIPITDQQIDQVMQRENAVDWIGRTILRYPPQSITLITLGPMTNVAFAHRLFPDMHSRLKRLVVMGGCLNARGNMGLTSEFNFACDPEAAHCILEEFNCPITIIPFDTCLLHTFTYEWYEGTVTKTNSIKSNFLRTIFQAKMDYVAALYKGQQGFYACDWLAMIVALNPCTNVVLESVHHYATVELEGQMTRGQMVIDWRDSVGGVKRKMEMIVRMDMDKVHVLFEKTIL